MLISSLDLSVILNRVERLNINSKAKTLLAIRVELERLQAHHDASLGGLLPPYALSIDTEKAMAVYLNDDLYKFVEEIDSDKEISFIDVGKLYLKIKPMLQEGRFRKAAGLPKVSVS